MDQLRQEIAALAAEMAALTRRMSELQFKLIIQKRRSNA